MKTGRMFKLAKFIENKVADNNFHMSTFGAEIKIDEVKYTVHCIGGWTLLLFDGEIVLQRKADRAQELLGLTDEEAGELFFYWPDGAAGDKKAAVERIREMARSGRTSKHS